MSQCNLLVSCKEGDLEATAVCSLVWSFENSNFIENISVGTTGSRHLQRNHICQTWQGISCHHGWCTHEFIVAVTACIRPAQDQICQNPSMDWTGTPQVPPLAGLRSYWQLIASEEENLFSLGMWPLRDYPCIHVSIDGPKPMQIQTALSGLCRVCLYYIICMYQY